MIFRLGIKRSSCLVFIVLLLNLKIYVFFQRRRHRYLCLCFFYELRHGTLCNSNVGLRRPQLMPIRRMDSVYWLEGWACHCVGRHHFSQISTLLEGNNCIIFNDHSIGYGNVHVVDSIGNDTRSFRDTCFVCYNFVCKDVITYFYRPSEFWFMSCKVLNKTWYHFLKLQNTP